MASKVFSPVVSKVIPPVGKLRPPGTPVRVTRSVAIARAKKQETSMCEKPLTVADKPAVKVIPSPSQGYAKEDVETVRCECGAREDDGEPLLQCEGCGVWALIACAGLTTSKAQKVHVIPVRSATRQGKPR